MVQLTDCQKTNEQEKNLPRVQSVALDVPKAVGESGKENGGKTVGTVPGGDTKRLLGSHVPLSGDDREQGQASGLEET
jgi:hypothetical protein